MINPYTGNEMLASVAKYVEDLQVRRIRAVRASKKSGSPVKRAAAVAEVAELDSWIEQAFVGEFNQRL